MSVATDDVHDLFGLDDDGESDDPTEEPDASDDSVTESDEGFEEADGAAEWPEFPSLEDDGSVASADPASDETAESTTASSAEAVEGDADEFESTESTMSFEGSADDEAGGVEVDPSTTPSEGSVEDPADASDSSGSPTMSSEGAAEDDVAGSEPAMIPGGEATEDDADEEAADEDAAGEDDADEDDADEDAAGEVEPAASATSADLSVEDDAVESETADPTTTSPERTVEDDTEESAPAASTTSPQDDAEESEPAGSPSSSQGTAEDDSGESRATTPPGEAAAGERDESEQERATASADATTTDAQGTAASGGTTTSTDGSPVGGATADGPATGRPTVDRHDVIETTSPDAPTSMASGTTVDEGVEATSSGSNRLPTGIDELDRAMGGGVPPGRLVVLVADPGVQSELIVDSVLAQRDTLFVTTDRPDWEVMKDIEPGLGSGEVVIRDHTPDSLLSGLDSLLDELGTSSNFVIDSVNELELLPRKRYRIFLSDVKRRLFDTGSVGLFTGVTVGHESARDLTLRRADIVWRLETRTTDREIENRLSVPKFRGGAALTETVKLELTDEVRVDTSWNDG